jgi:hypothetical protein
MMGESINTFVQGVNEGKGSSLISIGEENNMKKPHHPHLNIQRTPKNQTHE